MGIKFDEKSCGVLLYRENNNEKLFLLLHYPSGHWDLPKGHVEDTDADEHATAARELMEETGIADIEFVAGFREPISYKYRRKGRMSNKQVVFFLAKTNLQDIQISHEHQDFIWLPYDSAFKKLTFDNARGILQKSKDFLEL